MTKPKSSSSTFATVRPGPAEAAALHSTGDAGAVVHATGAVNRIFGLPIVSNLDADGPARPWASMATATNSRTAPFGNPEFASGMVLNCAVYGADASELTRLWPSQNSTLVMAAPSVAMDAVAVTLTVPATVEAAGEVRLALGRGGTSKAVGAAPDRYLFTAVFQWVAR